MLVPPETRLTCETYTLVCSEARRLQDMATECLSVLSACSARLNDVRTLQKRRLEVAEQLGQTRKTLEALAAQVFAKMGPRAQTKIRQDPEMRARCRQRAATRETRKALTRAQNAGEDRTLAALEREAKELENVSRRMFANPK